MLNTPYRISAVSQTAFPVVMEAGAGNYSLEILHDASVMYYPYMGSTLPNQNKKRSKPGDIIYSLVASSFTNLFPTRITSSEHETIIYEESLKPWLKLSESAFDFWDNDADSVYDNY
jgi:hypothetical protein